MNLVSPTVGSEWKKNHSRHLSISASDIGASSCDGTRLTIRNKILVQAASLANRTSKGPLVAMAFYEMEQLFCPGIIGFPEMRRRQSLINIPNFQWLYTTVAQDPTQDTEPLDHPHQPTYSARIGCAPLGTHHAQFRLSSASPSYSSKAYTISPSCLRIISVRLFPAQKRIIFHIMNTAEVAISDWMAISHHPPSLPVLLVGSKHPTKSILSSPPDPRSNNFGPYEDFIQAQSGRHSLKDFVLDLRSQPPVTLTPSHESARPFSTTTEPLILMSAYLLETFQYNFHTESSTATLRQKASNLPEITNNQKPNNH